MTWRAVVPRSCEGGLRHLPLRQRSLPYLALTDAYKKLRRDFGDVSLGATGRILETVERDSRGKKSAKLGIPNKGVTLPIP